jgi:hypothetical protein
MPRNAKALAGEMEDMWTRADREGRDLTAPEHEKMQELVDAASRSTRSSSRSRRWTPELRWWLG